MSYGRSEMTKFEYASILAACISLLVLKQQDAVGSVLFDNKIRSRVPLRTSQRHLTDILASLENAARATRPISIHCFAMWCKPFPNAD